MKLKMGQVSTVQMMMIASHILLIVFLELVAIFQKVPMQKKVQQLPYLIAPPAEAMVALDAA